jgi:hypothetical protein
LVVNPSTNYTYKLAGKPCKIHPYKLAGKPFNIHPYKLAGKPFNINPDKLAGKPINIHPNLAGEPSYFLNYIAAHWLDSQLISHMMCLPGLKGPGKELERRTVGKLQLWALICRLKRRRKCLQVGSWMVAIVARITRHGCMTCRFRSPEGCSQIGCHRMKQSPSMVLTN